MTRGAVTERTGDFSTVNRGPLAQGARVIIFLSFAAILFIGVELRLYGYFIPSLFADELWRAWVMSAPDVFGAMKALLNPQAVGYILMNTVVTWVYEAEWALKLSSLIPSLLSLAMICLIGFRLFRSNIARLYVLLVLALSPGAVEYTKYLKPYVLELFVHLVLIYCIVVYMETRTGRGLLLTLAAGALSGLFAINSIFVLPSIYLILFYLNRADKKGLMMTACGCLVSLALLFGHYLFIVSTIDLHKVVNMWITTDKNNIDTFYSGGFNVVRYLRWFTVSTIELMKTSVSTGPLRSFGGTIRYVTGYFYLVGLFFLLKDRNYKLLGLFLPPLALVLIFNIAGKWPYGTTRVNIFLIPYFLLVLGYGMDRVLRGRAEEDAPNVVRDWRTLARMAFPGFLRICLSAFFIVSIYVQLPHYKEQLKPAYIVQEGRSALEYLYSLHDVLPGGPGRPRVPLYLSFQAYGDLSYYLNYNKRFSREYGEFFKSAFTPLPHGMPGGAPSVRKSVAKILLEYPCICFFYAFYADYEERILENLVASGAINVLGSRKFTRALALCGTSSLYAPHGSGDPGALEEAMLRTYPSYRIGEPVRFTFVGEGFDASGFVDWDPVADDMWWTPDACPRIRFFLGRGEEMDEEVVFRLTYASAGNQRIEVLVNETSVGSLQYTGEGEETKEVSFRASLLRPGNVNAVRLKISGAPFKERDDVRYLSTAFKAFAIAPVE